MKKMEVKLADTCNDIMIMIDENLIPSSTAWKSFVFFTIRWKIIITCI